MKPGDFNISKRIKPNHKQIAIICIVVVAIVGTSAYIELSIVQPSMKVNSGKVNSMALHIHSNLKIMMDNKPLIIPTGIDINQTLWNDHSLDSYGMPAMGGMKGMEGMIEMAPLHTHSPGGLIHVESMAVKKYALGDFLRIWGVGFNGKVVKASANGAPISDFANHVLKDGEQINLDVH